LEKIVFRKIKKPPKTSELILTQIYNLILNGKLKPGDKLPSQTTLANEFGVKRNQIRDLMLKLEFFEIVKTKPQAGTYVSDFGETVLMGLITNMLDNDNRMDFSSLIEARRAIEVKIVQLVTQNATEEDISEIISDYKYHSTKINCEEKGLQEDMYWHLKLAKFSRNHYLKKSIMFLAPSMINYSRKITISDNLRLKQVLNEHWEIVKAIINKDEKMACDSMNNHLDMTLKMIEKNNIK